MSSKREWTSRRFWEARQFYSSYIVVAVGFLNFITIQYQLLLKNIPVVNTIFPSILSFGAILVIILGIVGVLGGHYLHRKRQFVIEQAISQEANPYIYKAVPGKEFMIDIPAKILDLDMKEKLWEKMGVLDDGTRKRIEVLRQQLYRLLKGESVGTDT